MKPSAMHLLEAPFNLLTTSITTFNILALPCHTRMLAYDRVFICKTIHAISRPNGH